MIRSAIIQFVEGDKIHSQLYVHHGGDDVPAEIAITWEELIAATREPSHITMIAAAYAAMLDNLGRCLPRPALHPPPASDWLGSRRISFHWRVTLGDAGKPPTVEPFDDQASIDRIAAAAHISDGAGQ